MTKTTIIVTLLCVILTSGVVFASITEPKPWVIDFFSDEIEIDGSIQHFSNPPILNNDVTYVPLREFCEKVGFDVYWNGEDGKITVSKNEEKFNLPYMQDVTQSETGKLSNGRAYSYISDPDFTVAIEREINEGLLTPKPQLYGAVPTAKFAADIAQTIFETDKALNIGDAGFLVYYNKDMDAWIVVEVFYGTTHGGSETVIIRRADGKILGRYSMR